MNLYSPSDIDYTTDPNNNWTCPKCLEELFPFFLIDDHLDFISTTSSDTILDLPNPDDLIYNPYDNNDDGGGVLGDIDPDSNYYNVQQPIPSSDYLHISDLNKKTANSPKSFSVMHLNIRSLSKNFKDFKSVLSLINHKFSVIALTETWVKPHNSELFHLDGYHHELILRTDKTGGGISIYLDETLDYKIRNYLSSIDQTMETLWVEIDKIKPGTDRNILLGCIYRIPGQNTDLFNAKISTLFSTISRENKIIYHTGDYNLDLIKHNTHPPTHQRISQHQFRPLP
jgi:hypothetical protein